MLSIQPFSSGKEFNLFWLNSATHGFTKPYFTLQLCAHFCCKTSKHIKLLPPHKVTVCNHTLGMVMSQWGGLHKKYCGVWGILSKWTNASMDGEGAGGSTTLLWIKLDTTLLWIKLDTVICQVDPESHLQHTLISSYPYPHSNVPRWNSRTKVWSKFPINKDKHSTL